MSTLLADGAVGIDPAAGVHGYLVEALYVSCELVSITCGEAAR